MASSVHVPTAVEISVFALGTYGTSFQTTWRCKGLHRHASHVGLPHRSSSLSRPPRESGRPRHDPLSASLLPPRIDHRSGRILHRETGLQPENERVRGRQVLQQAQRHVHDAGRATHSRAGGHEGTGEQPHSADARGGDLWGQGLYGDGVLPARRPAQVHQQRRLAGRGLGSRVFQPTSVGNSQNAQPRLDPQRPQAGEPPHRLAHTAQDRRPWLRA